MEIPAENTAVAKVPCAGYDIVVVFALQFNELWNEFGLQSKKKCFVNTFAIGLHIDNCVETYVMTQIGIHNNDEIAICVFYAMNVCSSQAQFRCSRAQQNFILAVDLLQLLRNILSAVGTAIVDDNDFKVDITANGIPNELITWQANHVFDKIER